MPPSAEPRRAPSGTRARVLILAGTTEATRLATTLDRTGVEVVSSLAGVTAQPVPRPGRVRRGGFGGIAGLADSLTDEAIDAVVDATHPFAAVMPHHAAAACRMVGVPLCRLLRDPWVPTDDRRWFDVADLDDAAITLQRRGARRVLLAVGRQSLTAFGRCAEQWFLVRSIEPVTTPLPQMLGIRARGPFTVDGEIELLRHHRIDTVVTKNAGGDATAAKLTAADHLGLDVVVVRRPAQPVGVLTVASVDAAAAWVTDQLE